jgi:thymidylate kinase
VGCNGLSAWQLLATNASYIWPNLNLVLEVPVEECLERIDERNRKVAGERELFERRETLERTLAAYHFLAPLIPCVELVDGTGTEVEVFARVREVVENNLLP